MRSRTVVRLIVVAAVSLFALYAPTQNQSASACPADHSVRREYWRDPICEGNPPICEQMEPMLLGVFTSDCQWVENCDGDCSGANANRIVITQRACPLCGDEEP